ncbi:MAG: FAD-dependent monooxygenase [Pseudomonadota bacterium]
MADILVIGAGPVGATFALLARARGLDVALIDARAGASQETRSLALSHGSRVLLERAGAWRPDLLPSEIHTIHTSQQGGFGRVRLSRDDVNVPALGYVVSYTAMQAVLDAALVEAGCQVTFGASVSHIAQTSDIADIQFTIAGETRSAQAKVIVMADGGANLDKLPGIKIDEKDYGQSAMLAMITSDQQHQHVAYERFTPEGPLALLPYPGNSNAHGDCDYAMVWVASHNKIDMLMALSDTEVRDQFQNYFGTRAGRFISLTKRRRYPLRLRQSSERVVGRVAIIGNAAQAMHPVAGQGFNLGLRDAQTLVNLLSDHSAESAFKMYSNSREPDVSRGVGFTDLLASAFLSDTATLRMPRGLALAAVDMLPVARRWLLSRMLFGARP